MTILRQRDLALDRTNWTIGRSDVNILTLALVTRRFASRCSSRCSAIAATRPASNASPL
ncbi:hypothetical protein [Jiella sonneratiae]|uniref:Uncharacterized protein n=1 Tax=Jiella sonneratiae TaxID=2816856 RepID=A0ABS3J9R9_9HYPH|nr:hypothetical protein [Jiella sonneratiae]MBO0906419.1 hypothetical protein [Jiella sonneratiae]